MDFKDKLRKAAGLFVELPPEENTSSDSLPPFPADDYSTDKVSRPDVAPVRNEPVSAPKIQTVEQIVSNTAGPSLDEIKSAASAAPSPVPSGEIDFQAIYQQAGIPVAAFTVEQTLDMLAKLPADLPLDTKRQMLKVTISSMGTAIGATAESIVTDATRKLSALSGYADSAAKRTKEYVNSTEQEIIELQKQIDEKKASIQKTMSALEQISTACHNEADRLDDVLEFFSLDIPPSKNAS